MMNEEELRLDKFIFKINILKIKLWICLMYLFVS